MGAPAFLQSRRHKVARRASTDITLNSSTWANVDTGLDIVLPGGVGDDFVVGANGFVENEAVAAFFDVVTVVSAAPVNGWGNQGAVSAPPYYGISSWRCPSGVQHSFGPASHKTIVAGDIDANGFVTCRLRYIANGAKTLYAGANYRFEWWVWNRGPADPD